MESNSLFVIRSINLAILTPVVCKSIQREWFEIQTWRVNPLQEEAGNPVGLSLYRFEGTGHDQEGQHIPWSVILKVVQSPANTGMENYTEAGDPTQWKYWEPEALVYSPETLPISTAAPSCFGVAELPGDITLLWLEDVPGSS